MHVQLTRRVGDRIFSCLGLGAQRKIILSDAILEPHTILVQARFDMSMAQFVLSNCADWKSVFDHDFNEVHVHTSTYNVLIKNGLFSYFNVCCFLCLVFFCCTYHTTLLGTHSGPFN